MKYPFKNIFFIIVIVTFVFAFPFIYIVAKNIQNDLPLREYVKESLLKRVNKDIHRFFSFTSKDRVKLPALYLSINEKQLQKLDSIIVDKLDAVDDEDLALTGQNQWPYVKATIALNDTLHNIKIRIRGDMPSNYNRGLENATYRINIVSETAIYGKQKLSLVRPFLENNFYGYLFSHFFEHQGFISNDIHFIRLYFNGKDNGIYYLQEGFAKELIESASYREGALLRFKNDCEDNNGTYNNSGFPELTAYSEKKTLKDTALSNIYSRAIFKYKSLQENKLKPYHCFNIKQFAKYFALCDIFLAHHSYVCHNVKLYFNPINDKFEPVAWDPANFIRYKIKLPVNPGFTHTAGQLYGGNTFYPIHNILNQDTTYLKEFNSMLYQFTHNSEVTDYISQYKQVIEDLDPELYRQRFQEKHSSSLILNNITCIKNWFTTDNRITANVYRTEKFLVVHSLSNLPILITQLKLDSGIVIPMHKVLLPFASDTIAFASDNPETWGRKFSLFTEFYGLENTSQRYKGIVFEKKDNINSALLKETIDTILLRVDKKNNSISFRNPTTKLTKSVFIPAGYKFYMSAGTEVTLLNNSNIISESAIVALGTKQKPIKFYSDGTGGVLIKNCENTSELHNVTFNGLSSPSDGNWSVTGAVTFYNCTVNITSCAFNNNNSEDALNIVRGKFTVDSCTFTNTKSDALDIDFGSGSIKNTNITNVKNDALDISGAYVEIFNVVLSNIGDKGLSGGERANIYASGMTIDNAFIGVASKDKSVVSINSSAISHTKYIFAVFQKKAVYGPAVLLCENVVCDEKKYMIEKNSILIANSDTLFGKQNAVYNYLYP